MVPCPLALLTVSPGKHGNQTAPTHTHTHTHIYTHTHTHTHTHVVLMRICNGSDCLNVTVHKEEQVNKGLFV